MLVADERTASGSNLDVYGNAHVYFPRRSLLMKCPQCGNNIDPAARFCGSCGKKLEPQVGGAPAGSSPSPAMSASNPSNQKTIMPGGMIMPPASSAPRLGPSAAPAASAPRPMAVGSGPGGQAGLVAKPQSASPAPIPPASMQQAKMGPGGGGSKDPFVGQVLNGRYLIETKLGQGGFGAVYKGKQTIIGRDVALKVLHPEMARDPNLLA